MTERIDCGYIRPRILTAIIAGYCIGLNGMVQRGRVATGEALCFLGRKKRIIFISIIFISEILFL